MLIFCYNLIILILTTKINPKGDTNMAVSLAELKETFAKMYGTEGTVHSYFAPGRVNLIGEHTDYNGGHVFP